MFCCVSGLVAMAFGVVIAVLLIASIRKGLYGMMETLERMATGDLTEDLNGTNNLAKEIISKAKEQLDKKPICNHDYNELMSFYKTIVIDSKNKPENLQMLLNELENSKLFC